MIRPSCENSWGSRRICLASVAYDHPTAMHDAKAVQGSWTPTKAELAGQAFPEAILKSISLRLDDGKYEVSVAGRPDKGTYMLDPAGKPKGMTVTGTEGPNKGKTFPAIYEIE